MQVADEPVFVDPVHLLACEEGLQPRYHRFGDDPALFQGRCLGDERGFRVDDPRWGAADCPRPKVLKLPQRCRVEGARLDTLDPERSQAAAHLARGAGGEGNCEDVLWLLAPGEARVADPVGDRPCLARAGSGQHTNRPIDRGRNRPLLGIQSVEHLIRGHP
jgi:hypothetical protein